MNEAHELLRRALEMIERNYMKHPLVRDINDYLANQETANEDYFRGWNDAIDAAIKECQVMIKHPQRQYGTGKVKGHFEMRRRGQECEIAIKGLRK